MATDPLDYSACDPVLLAAAQAYIEHNYCQRHMRRTLDVNEVGPPCGSRLRLAPVGKRVITSHKGRTVVLLQCVEWQHGQIHVLEWGDRKS